MHDYIENILLTSEISACQYKNTQLTVAFSSRTSGGMPYEGAFSFRTSGGMPYEGAFSFRTSE